MGDLADPALLSVNTLTRYVLYSVCMNVSRLPSLLSHEIRTSVTRHLSNTQINWHTLASTSTNKQQINPKKWIISQLRGREMDPQLALSLGVLNGHHCRLRQSRSSYTGQKAHLPHRHQERQGQDADTHGWMHFWGFFDSWESTHTATFEHLRLNLEVFLLPSRLKHIVFT